MLVFNFPGMRNFGVVMFGPFKNYKNLLRLSFKTMLKIVFNNKLL